MTVSLSLEELREITEAALLPGSDFPSNYLATGIVTDSRTLSPGQVFLALRGDKFDGHDFAATAAERGALACIVEHPVSFDPAPAIPQLQVPDTLAAYQKIARWWRDQFTIPLIAITGSVGKTTTKELIAAVLETQGKVHKTEANYNNEIGVPKTLLELDTEDDFAVIEMAMRARGEIALLSQIARPTIAVITNVGTAHIGRLGSEQAIAEAKCELLSEMPAASLAILNHDNPRLLHRAAKVWQGETITYGLEGGDIRGELVNSQTLRLEGMDFLLPLPGRHNALNYLAALAVAKALGIDWTLLTEGLSVNLPGGRSRRCDLPQDITILDETYNAGLESTLAALGLLAETPGKRRIAVLGAMKELGEYAPRFHRQVGEAVKELRIDRLFILVNDPQAEAIAAGASGMPIVCAATHEDLLQQIIETVEPGDRWLFKASNSVQLNRVVESFISRLTSASIEQT
jgi:UDP-N-acetylmuramoyl-tripeptide--D-alanyl-D-alanine ligase